MHTYRSYAILAIAIILLSLGAAVAALHGISVKPANATLEMYDDLNRSFARRWKARSGVAIALDQARSKSGIPIRATMDGRDVMALALSLDVDALKKNSRFSLPEEQKPPLQKNGPFATAVVFLVRKGNPRKIEDWSDLVQPGVEVVTPDPKTSLDARWNYLAAWGSVARHAKANDSEAFKFMKSLFANVGIRDSSLDESIKTFVEGGAGDVLLIWENQAHLLAKDFGGRRFEVVTPSVSIMAESPVSVVLKRTDEQQAGKDEQAGKELVQAYVEYLHAAEAQDIAARHFYRPQDSRIASKYAAELPPMELITIDDAFGGWKQAQLDHFVPGAFFDKIQSSS